MLARQNQSFRSEFNLSLEPDQNADPDPRSLTFTQINVFSQVFFQIKACSLHPTTVYKNEKIGTDQDQWDPQLFGLPGSGSNIICFRSGSGVSFHIKQ
jgi:hypothetical protein